MKIKQLITELKQVEEEHGNLEVLNGSYCKIGYTNLIEDKVAREEGPFVMLD